MRSTICFLLFFLASIQNTTAQSIDIDLSVSDSSVEKRKDPDKNENEKVIIYPIPAFFELNVKSEKYKMIKYIIYDVNGKEICGLSFDNLLEFEISIDELAAGLYFIKLHSVDNFIFTRKFLKF